MALPQRNHNLCSTKPVNGFTLVELLVVLAIFAITAMFTMPAVNTVLRGSQLTQAGQLIGDQLNFARQSALSSNHAVEVRIYQYGDPQTPGEQAANPSSGKYRAMQLFQIQDSGNAVALGKSQLLPPSIIIDQGNASQNTTLSSIISSATTSSVPTSTTGSALGAQIPRTGLQYNCVSFRFNPDGSTNLSPTSAIPWFLTLHNINDGDGQATSPANFIIVQVDAANGHVKTIRP